MGAMYNIIYGFFILSSIVLIVFVMFRKGESSGFSGAFGGLGGDTAFGVKAQKQLDKVISYIATIFMISAIILSTPKFRSILVTKPGEVPERTGKEVPDKEPVTQPKETPDTPKEAPGKDNSTQETSGKEHSDNKETPSDDKEKK